VTSTLIAVVAGSVLGAWVQPRVVTTLAGLSFIAIGVWMLVRG
jgi:putative Ca2+/H+ antiporter (TMEM165/GDT1 family)